MAVYHLHGQTSRFTVWVNGKKIQELQISSLNRVYHSVQISSIKKE